MANPIHVWGPLMTTPSQFRLTDEVKAKLDALAQRWGGIEPVTRTAVVVEAINRAHAAEFPAKQSRKTHAAKI
jgi:predicted transcriptional regulator